MIYEGVLTRSMASHTLLGVLGTDLVSYVGGTASFDTKNVGIGKTVTATGLSLWGDDAGNYTVNSTTTTTADITTRTLTVTATGTDKIYDGLTIGAVALSDNRVTDDVFSASYGNAAF